MSNQCNTLDALVGDLLPHVYCKKITLENHSAQTRTKITISLEVYEERDKISKSGWLTDFKLPSGRSILDSFYIKLLLLMGQNNAAKLSPSNKPEFLNNYGIPTISNFYVLKQYSPDTKYMNITGLDKSNLIHKRSKVRIGSLLGDYNAKDIITAGKFNRKPREEYKNGKWYIVIPFQHYFILPNSMVSGDVGLAFYSYLDMEELFPEKSKTDPYVQGLSLEGPINTEMIFKGGSVARSRESFIMPGGKLWEGPVHYHGDDNPSPGGYMGWMVGQTHRPNTVQEKLQLLDTPNHKIVDFRDTSVIIPNSDTDEVLGLGKDSLIGLGPSYEKAEKIIQDILSPLQKEKKRDFLVDNDDEYSKLYISRDAGNNAHGMFHINFKNLLENNSKLFSIFSDSYKYMGPLLGLNTPAQTLKEILQESKIQELRIYRDRVTPKNAHQPYKKFADNKTYEEPSRLIGRLVDKNSYKSPQTHVDSTDTSINEIELRPAESYINRYFTFSDYEVGKYDAGLYQYRIEVDFFDGTNIFINKLIKELRSVKLELEEYYKFAMAGRRVSSDFTYRSNYTAESGKKIHYIPYYDDVYKSFSDEFLVDAEYKFSEQKEEEPIWFRAPKWIIKTYIYFIDNAAFVDTLASNARLINLMSPESGSPSGINFCIRIMDTVITKVESIAGVRKNINNSNNLSLKSPAIDQTILSNTFDRNITSKSIIKETHSFDNPKEIFDATVQNDVYVDYLNLGNSRNTFIGLRAMSPEDYRIRIRLENAKFVSTSEAAANIDANLGNSVNLQTYGYLTPSEIKISDASKTNKSFHFVQRSFDLEAYDRITSSDTENLNNASLIASNFTNYAKYDSLLVSLVNYNLNKKQNRNVDLATPPNILSADASDQERGFKQRDGVYRKFFDSINLTLHDVKKHDSYLDPRRKILKDQDNNIEFPLKLENFSEALGIGSIYLSQCLNHKDQKIVKLPSGKMNPYDFSDDLPNNFKVWALKQYGINSFHSPEIDQLLDNPDNRAYNAFKYFNFNMTAVVEVYAGSSAFPCDDNWEILKEAHVSALGTQDTLFCRIKYYDINLLGEMTMPMIDNYFLISNRAIQYDIESPLISLSSVIADIGTNNANMIRKQISAKLTDFASILSNQANPAPQTSIVRAITPAVSQTISVDTQTTTMATDGNTGGMTGGTGGATGGTGGATGGGY